MHWEVLIIPLIALGVWILGTLFKGEEERAKKGVRRPGNLSGRAPTRRPVTDLDRFLEEARRRREAEEKRKAPPPPPPPPPPRPSSSRPPLSERPPRQRETSLRPARPTVRAEEIPMAIPVVRPAAPPVVAEVVVTAPRLQPVAELPPPSPPTPIPTLQRDVRPAPIPQQVRSLLSKPQTAGAAFVLREIFDRPLCQRRRR
jgi:hypothetical protein